MDIRNRNIKVDEFLDGLGHSRKAEVQQLRLAILAAEPAIIETIKWNAPNFRFDDVDRVTFRLQPRDCVQLIFHRGARVRDDQDEFRFDEPTGLLDWLSPDRGVVTFTDADETDRLQEAVPDLVRRWVRA